MREALRFVAGAALVLIVAGAALWLVLWSGIALLRWVTGW